MFRSNVRYNAFRYEIRQQIIDFKKHNWAKQGEQADHITPLCILVKRFLIEQGISWHEVGTVPIQHKIYSFRLSDRKLARDWQQYHKENAQLRIISAEQNERKATSDLVLFRQA